MKTLPTMMAEKEFFQLKAYYLAQKMQRLHGLHKASSKRTVKGRGKGVHFRGTNFSIISATKI